jgi:hypothetical protein
MTTRQRTAWAQVGHLWANGGKVEGVTRLGLRHELRSPNSERSDLITITKYGTFEPRIQLRTSCLPFAFSNRGPTMMAEITVKTMQP